MVMFYCMCQIVHRDERTQPVNMLDSLSWIPESPHNGGRTDYKLSTDFCTHVAHTYPFPNEWKNLKNSGRNVVYRNPCGYNALAVEKMNTLISVVKITLKRILTLERTCTKLSDHVLEHKKRHGKRLLYLFLKSLV